VPVTAALNQYATWDNGTNTYASLEAAPTYGVLEGGRLTITRTLPSSGTLGRSRALSLRIGGSLVPTGQVPSQRTLRRSYVGSLVSSGLVLLGKIFTRSLGGTLHPSGTVGTARMLRRSWSGTFAPTGAFSYRYLFRWFITYEGRLWPVGDLRLEVRRGLWPPFALTLTPSSPAPATVPSAKPVAPYATPVKAPSDWPPFHAEPR